MDGVSLFIQPWIPNFYPSLFIVKFIPAWVNLHSLSLEYMQIEVLETLGNMIETFMKLDNIFFTDLTSLFYMCIILDGKKIIPKMIMIHSKLARWHQFFLIENILSIGSNCHHISHNS